MSTPVHFAAITCGAVSGAAPQLQRLLCIVGPQHEGLLLRLLLLCGGSACCAAAGCRGRACRVVRQQDAALQGQRQRHSYTSSYAAYILREMWGALIRMSAFHSISDDIRSLIWGVLMSVAYETRAGQVAQPRDVFCTPAAHDKHADNPAAIYHAHLPRRQHNAGGRGARRQRQPLKGGQRPGAAGELHLGAAAHDAARQLRCQDAVVAAALLSAMQ